MLSSAQAGSGRGLTAELMPRLSAAAGDALLEAVSAPDMDEMAIAPNALLAVAGVLQSAGFNMLLDIGATDHLPLTPRFEVAYHFLALPEARVGSPALPARLRLRVFADGPSPSVPSLCGKWPSANWAEREVYDLFGVRFEGHPELQRIMMPDDWQGHPLRKDYPLRGTDRRFNPGGRAGSVPPVRET
jgi:NADH-quinone oxidoreductase subunit C